MRYRRNILMIVLLLLVACKKYDSDKYQYETIDGKTVTLEELKEATGIFIVISATCPSCYKFYKHANRLSENKIKDLSYIAILTDSISVLEEYKKGTLYKAFGFLNSDWTVIPNKELASILDKNYDFDKDGTPYIFLKQNDSIISTKKFKNEKELIEELYKLTK